MRIVGGRHKGRRLQGPEGRTLRPTSDRAREALFNLLAHGPYETEAGPMPHEVAVLDVFAGSGALGLEALSRGARHVTFLENSAAALALIRRNAAGMADADEITIRRLDAARPGPAPRTHGLVLMDPPYGAGLWAPALAALMADGWLEDDAVVVVELAKDEDFAAPAGFEAVDERRYGAARLVILRRGERNQSH
ncbi:MAG: 16S rRNA (guanine(966)-N(2))-methyltransferase RsmD [Alphaproteobacteria bacterium]|jgi:16S rRNA (guanine966-N2)-methyltransferase|nr:16S rRNA (guanine(966)-N(2))-methyltransferase RsmD [Alphaproteobacteria bacterium]